MRINITIKMILFAIIVAIILPAFGAEENPPIGYMNLLGFDKLPLLFDYPMYQASSYDRKGGNSDAYNFLRVEPNGEQVMLEAEGPGCIFRFWTTGVVEPNMPIQSSDKARILMYFDGEKEPRIDLSVPEMFGMKNKYPFIPPLSRSFESGRGAWEGHASICYVPIPFAKSIKITGKNMSFYHINYYVYPKDTKIDSFTMNVSAENKKIMEEASKILNAVGKDPKPIVTAKTQSYKESGKIEAGKSKQITVKGPAIIDRLFVKLPNPTHKALRGLELQITFDNASGPSVRTTLGDFFGTGCEDRRFKTLPLGMTDDGYYCYYPMPFRQNAIVSIVNATPAPVDVEFTVEAHNVESIADNAGYFHAYYSQEKEIPTGKDFNILTTEGRGKFLGCNLTMQSSKRGSGIFFLEGDEKIYVDGETWPSRFLGTGAEDYFNGAYFWNAVKFEHGPYSGLTYIDWGTKRVCAYRWQITDAVTFTKSIKADIEHGPVSNHPSDYAGVAYWYQLPAVGLPELPPLKDRMPETSVASPPGMTQAVKILSGPKVGDKELLTRRWQDADPEYYGEFPQKYWKAKGAGEIVTFEFESLADEVFKMSLFLTQSPDGAAMLVSLDGKSIGLAGTYDPQFIPWVQLIYQPMRLTKGKHVLTLKTLQPGTGNINAFTIGWVGVNFTPTSEYITKWYVIGPFPNVDSSGFDKAYPPEQSIDLKAEYEVIGGKKASWKPVEIAQGKSVKPDSLMEGGDWRIAYGLTYIWSPEPMETAIMFGKDDGAKIWVNDSLVFNQNTWSHCFPDSQLASVTLKKGWNKFLIKCANHGGSWGWMVRIADPDKKLKTDRDMK